MSIRLTLRPGAVGPIDGSAVRPDAFAALSEAEIARLPLPAPVPAALGDVFDVAGGHSDDVWLEGELSRVHRLGSGMRGGRILARGPLGDEAGARMRRGLVAIAGGAGERTGLEAIAGTILVLGDLGRDAGFGLKRGSLVAGGALELLPTFRLACTYRPVVLELLLRSLARLGFSEAARLERGAFRRWIGDCADLGRGEILHWVAP